MNTLDAQVLTAILRDFDHLRAIDPNNIDRRYDTARFCHVEDAHKRRLIPLSVALWTGDGTAAGMKAGQRALARLEASGAIVRVARWGSRATHIELTQAGEKLARELLPPEADRATIRKALTASTWATPEHIAAVDEEAKR